MNPSYTLEKHQSSNRILLSGFIGLALAVLALIVLVTVMFLKIQRQAASQNQIQHILLSGCQRQNILRLSDNNAHYGDYVVFSFVDKRFLVPTPTETPAQKKITHEFATALNHAVADAEWTPPTNCAKSVGTQGAQYESPTPIPFKKRLPPPSALPTR